jgi:hypothetical protein
MDAERTVAETVSELRKNMGDYAKSCNDWVAPYTSFVTSSMMGKSRHMKEVANHLPCVYICLRGEVRGYGYPRPSPSIVKWSLMGAARVGQRPMRSGFQIKTRPGVCQLTSRRNGQFRCTPENRNAPEPEFVIKM